MKPSKILWVRERFHWMGSHSGYDQLCEVMSKILPANYLSAWKEPGKRLPTGSKRFLYRLAKNTKASPFYDVTSIAADVSALSKCCFHRPDITHITYVENNLGILPKYGQSFYQKLIGTAHQPVSWWRLIHPHPESVRSLDALIVPASREVSYFEQFLPGRVYFIPHGVDTHFFRPLPEEKISFSAAPRCVFSGTWLRDIQTLTKVIDKVLVQNPGIQFDILVPRMKRDEVLFHWIARHEQVSWHSGVSDEQLRNIYQQASLLVLPIIDCTANNAVLEAMSCGLPIISNRVGGLLDYTNSSFADLFEVGDVSGMATAILNLVDNMEEKKRRSQFARIHAEQNFGWEVIAEATFNLYLDVLKGKYQSPALN